MRSVLLLVISLFLSLSICVLTISTTIDTATWSAVEGSFLRCVLLTMLIVAGEVLCRAIRQTTMASAIRQRLSLGASGKITLLGDFACTVTPSRLGGDPARLYGLVRERISWGHASVLLAGEFVTSIVFLLSVLIVVTFWGDHGAADNVAPMSLFPTLWPIALALCSFTIGGHVVFRYAPAIERWCRYLLHLALIRRLLKEPRCDRAEQRVGIALQEFRSSTSLLLSQGKGLFFLSGVAALGHGLLRFAVLPVLAAGLGLDVSLKTLVIWQLIAFYGLSFAPIPGGSGTLEVGFILFFSPFVPSQKLGLLLAAWRFFTYYLYLVVGGVVFWWVVRGRVAGFWQAIMLRRAPVAEKGEGFGVRDSG